MSTRDAQISERVGYTLIPGQESDDTDQQGGKVSTVPLHALREERSKLDEQEQIVLQRVEELVVLFESRKAPFSQELNELQKKMAKLDVDIDRAERALREPDMPDPPGPASLAWVEGQAFPIVSNIMVGLNLASMLFAADVARMNLTRTLDNAFLTWYIFELLSKAAYHQRNLFIGKIGVVSWNWLDMVIVLGGILDQWLMTVILLLSGAGPDGASSAFGAIKFLRFLRVLRVLKFLRALFEGDASWTESAPFEIFMSGVISVNAVVMSLELDIEWSGWVLVENAFMLIYTFELIMKLKLQGRVFFVNMSTMIWNFLDIVLVIGGALDLWLFPGMRLIHEALGESPAKDDNLETGMMSRIMSLLRLMRIMRVLRLVRLLKTIKPLYRLLLGVIESLKAMQWVMVLTMLMLYAGAIFWTSLVGKGLLYGGVPPADGIKHFGSVPTSLFSLFRIMNGDTSVVRSVTHTVFGQLLFAGFMVLSNWAILAILTSVVSDNMITASQQAAEEDRKKEKDDEYCHRVKMLNALFREIDQDGSGCIDENEWKDLCKDTSLFQELKDATSCRDKDLQDLFTCLSASKARIDDVTGEAEAPQLRTMFFQDFLEHLKITADPADKQCVLQLMARLQFMERKLEKQLANLWDSCTAALPAGACTTQPLQFAAHEAAESSRKAGVPPAAPSRSPRLSKSKQTASPSGSARGMKPHGIRRSSGSLGAAALSSLERQQAITQL